MGGREGLMIQWNCARGALHLLWIFWKTNRVMQYGDMFRNRIFKNIVQLPKLLPDCIKKPVLVYFKRLFHFTLPFKSRSFSKKL